MIHVMKVVANGSRIGGGDQIYNDGIRVHGPLQPWSAIPNPKKRRDFKFPESLRKKCDEYYVSNYIKWLRSYAVSINILTNYLQVLDRTICGCQWANTAVESVG